MNMTTHDSTEDRTSDYDNASSLRALAQRFQEMKRGVQLKLASSSAGRIVLHMFLAVMTCRFAWHFQGILRELTSS